MRRILKVQDHLGSEIDARLLLAEPAHVDGAGLLGSEANPEQLGRLPSTGRHRPSGSVSEPPTGCAKIGLSHPIERCGARGSRGIFVVATTPVLRAKDRNAM